MPVKNLGSRHSANGTGGARLLTLSLLSVLLKSCDREHSTLNISVCPRPWEIRSLSFHSLNPDPSLPMTSSFSHSHMGVSPKLINHQTVGCRNAPRARKSIVFFLSSGSDISVGELCYSSVSLRIWGKAQTWYLKVEHSIEQWKYLPVHRSLTAHRMWFLFGQMHV